MTADIAAAEAIRTLLEPRTVAVIGASATDRNKVGSRALIHVLQHGPGADSVFAVHPTAENVLDAQTVRSVSNIDRAVDVAVIALPAGKVVECIEECGRAGTKTAIILSSGFAEMGGSGIALQRDLASAAAAANVRLVGPNCIGIVNCQNDLALSFGTSLVGWTEPLQGGRIALVTQSGALAMQFLNNVRREGVGLASLISTGNEADLTFCDFVEYLADSPEVGVILGYVENIVDGARFADALAYAAERDKPVGLLKGGRGGAGARAAAAHTAALVGREAALRAVLERYGVMQAEDLEDLLSIGLATEALRGRSPRRLAIVTGSGGQGVILSDHAEAVALEVPEFSEGLQSQLHDVLPAFAGVSNPVDGTGHLIQHPEWLYEVCRILGETTEIDAVLCGMPGLADFSGSSDWANPILFYSSGDQQIAAELNQEGVPCFVDASRGVRAIAQVRMSRELRKVTRNIAKAFPEGTGEAGAWPAGSDSLDDLGMLEAAGLPVVRRRTCTPSELGRVAAGFAGAVILKAHRADLAHKSELGGVSLPLMGSDKAAISQFAVATAGWVEWYELQEYVQPSWELLVSTTTDDIFGRLVTVGVGGILVEAVGEVKSFVPPLDADVMAYQLRSTPLASVLGGARGRQPVAPEALASLAAGLINVAQVRRLESIECNPVIVDRSGRLVIVDVLVEAAPDNRPVPADRENAEHSHIAGMDYPNRSTATAG